MLGRVEIIGSQRRDSAEVPFRFVDLGPYDIERRPPDVPIPECRECGEIGSLQ
jgi:hypothetical protein